jgi:DDE superfamily endonuclease
MDLLDDGDGILIADETGVAKSSTDAVAVARQYSGSVGGVDLCQVAVYLTFAPSAGHYLIGRRLYFTMEWAGDEERRELAGVPDELCFATKPHLTVDMLRTAVQQGISASFFLGDEVYGGRELRTACHELDLGYVLGVRSNHQVTTPATKLSVAKAAARLPKRAWQRMWTGAGQKGVRDYDWAMIEVTADDTPDGHDSDAGTSVLLVRRHRYTRTVSYYRCFAPQAGDTGETGVTGVLQVACGGRFPGREGDLPPRQRPGHLLELLAPLERDHPGRLRIPGRHRRPRMCRPTGRNDPAEADLVPLSSNELLRLLRTLILPQPRRDPEHLLWWSTWRRRHQHRARLCHRRWYAYADTTP